ncbi:MAG: hypothetical protein A2Y96_00200 [Firmicutes bacterium RBG_13_65_8]|nr:MAG: hypothetical protein A2Y96_00200 [Firmicutes bacterium RBG_13_65_8]
MLSAALGGRLTAGGGPAAGAGPGDGVRISAGTGFALDTLACLETWLARLDGDSAGAPVACASGERGGGA